MDVVFTILHVIVCVFLVAVVLLQRGRGAQVGAVFGGGGGGTMFGSRGAGNFLTKLTTIAAAIFMATSLSLSYLGVTGNDERLFDDLPEEAATGGPALEEFGLEDPAAEAPAAPQLEEMAAPVLEEVPPPSE